jgi:hypothetical protein
MAKVIYNKIHNRKYVSPILLPLISGFMTHTNPAKKGDISIKVESGKTTKIDYFI